MQLDVQSMRGEKADRRPLLALAKRISSLRRDRAQYFEPEIFSDAGWDILLSLYIAKREHEPMTEATVCEESGVPPSIAVRWLQSLAELRLVKRMKKAHGEQSSRVELTGEGVRRMECFLTDAWMTLSLSG
jgi:DNA-binding MarR family transcriptional regulator